MIAEARPPLVADLGMQLALGWRWAHVIVGEPLDQRQIAGVGDTIVFAMDDDVVEVRVGPIEGSLDEVVELGD